MGGNQSFFGPVNFFSSTPSFRTAAARASTAHRGTDFFASLQMSATASGNVAAPFHAAANCSGGTASTGSVMDHLRVGVGHETNLDGGVNCDLARFSEPLIKT